MNCINLKWNSTVQSVLILLMVVIITNGCSNKNKSPSEKKPLISENTQIEKENIKPYLTKGLCISNQGDYPVLLLHPGECISCYPIIKEKIDEKIRQAEGCKVLVVLPAMKKEMKDHLTGELLNLDSLKTKVIQKTGVVKYLVEASNLSRLDGTYFLQVDSHGKVVNKTKFSPK